MNLHQIVKRAINALLWVVWKVYSLIRSSELNFTKWQLQVHLKSQPIEETDITFVAGGADAWQCVWQATTATPVQHLAFTLINAYTV